MRLSVGHLSYVEHEIGGSQLNVGGCTQVGIHTLAQYIHGGVVGTSGFGAFEVCILQHFVCFLVR